MHSQDRSRSLAQLEVDQLLSAIAFDDDDVADYLGRLAVLCLVKLFYNPVEYKYSEERRSLIARRVGGVRASLILEETEIGKRLDTYAAKLQDADQELPF